MDPTSSERARQSPIRFKRGRFLTREEEAELARGYRDTRDPALARRLVESHLLLVARIARQCGSRQEILPDLIQEGTLGLMRAVEKYDPDRGIRLSSYAAWWIRAFIYQYIMANARMLRIATTFAQRKLYFQLNRESQRLEREGKPALSQDIADRLALPERVVAEMQARMAGRDVSFQTTVSVDAGLLQQRLDGATGPQRPDELVEDQQLHRALIIKVRQLAAGLGARDRTIFDERLMAERPATLRELGLRFGISRERARQLEEKLKERLRPLLSEFAGDLGPHEAAASA